MTNQEAKRATQPDSVPQGAAASPAPPIAIRKPEEHVIHGDARRDDYGWLRNKGDAAVIAYLSEENRYTDAVMRGTEQLQESLYQEMLGRILQTDLSVPYRLRGYDYFTRTEEGKQYPMHARRALRTSESGSNENDSPEQLLLDLNVLAEGHSFLGLGSFDVSDDNNLLAYSTDVTGFRQFTLHVKSLRTGETFADRIDRVTSTAWASDNHTIFYTVEDETTKRSHRLYRHLVAAGEPDILLYE
ncbi:MAG TPA: oligopeptidase B, partial [Candidatus Dormibacteraeota bacterium]|nr:oligopeptidase B [Candidatus Dormibacteraeota bacterium]